MFKFQVEGGCDIQTIQMIIISKKLQPHSLIFPVSITSYYANLMTIEKKSSDKNYGVRFYICITPYQYHKSKLNISKGYKFLLH